VKVLVLNRGSSSVKFQLVETGHRPRSYVATYVGALGGLDALAFVGGIGEKAPCIMRGRPLG
jgi:acetate kinase